MRLSPGFHSVTPQELKKRLDQTGHFDKEGSWILSLYQHPRGDMSVLMETEAGQQEAEEDIAWLSCLAPSAQIVQRRYQVLVHGVCTKDMDTSDQRKATKALQEENVLLHPELCIVGQTYEQQTGWWYHHHHHTSALASTFAYPSHTYVLTCLDWSDEKRQSASTVRSSSPHSTPSFLSHGRDAAVWR